MRLKRSTTHFDMVTQIQILVLPIPLIGFPTHNKSYTSKVQSHRPEGFIYNQRSK